MLYLLFRMSDSRMALETHRVVEVVPWVALDPVPGAPAYIAGLFDYRGRSVPVVDLCRLAAGEPCACRMSTRVVLVKYRGGGEREEILGLLAEQVTETLKREPSEFSDSGIHLPESPFLGRVSSDDEGMIQLVEVESLLPEDVRRHLFNEAVA